MREGGKLHNLITKGMIERKCVRGISRTTYTCTWYMLVKQRKNRRQYAQAAQEHFKYTRVMGTFFLLQSKPIQGL